MRKRLVFLGDSITDGHTLILHVEQTLEALGQKAVCLNAGVSGDRADQMISRIGRDILPLRGDTIFISAGINDAIQGIPPSHYEASLIKMIEAFQKAGLETILVTPTPLASEHEAARKLVLEYTAILYGLAQRHGLLVADAGKVMSAAILSGIPCLLAPDGIHLEEPGYKYMASAVLAVLGYPHAPLSTRPRWEPIPGLIKYWTLTVEETSDEATYNSGSSLTWAVPEAEPGAGWWDEQERMRGYALRFMKSLPGKTWRAESVLPPGDNFTLCIGGHVCRITVDDDVVYENKEWRGWHLRPILDLPGGANPRRLRLHVTGAFVASRSPT